MNSVIMDWLITGMLAATFIVIGKMIFVGYNVPVANKFFAAV